MRKDIEEMLNIKTGDYITIFDNSNHIFLLSGKITHATENPKGYSIGGLIFFNPNSNKFLINKVGFVDTVININEIEKGNYKIIQHNNIDNTFEYDFFMWNDIEPEVQETCELLNQLGFVKTYSSCCGHGKIPAYIDFNILNLESFFSFVNIMNKYGLCSYCAKHGELEEGYKFRLVIGVEGEKTCHLELVDINSTFDKFNTFLKKYLKINGKF